MGPLPSLNGLGGPQTCGVSPATCCTCTCALPNIPKAGSWRKGQEHGLGRLSFPVAWTAETAEIRCSEDGHSVCGAITEGRGRRIYQPFWRQVAPWAWRPRATFDGFWHVLWAAWLNAVPPNRFQHLSDLGSLGRKMFLVSINRRVEVLG